MATYLLVKSTNYPSIISNPQVYKTYSEANNAMRDMMGRDIYFEFEKKCKVRKRDYSYRVYWDGKLSKGKIIKIK